METIYVDHDSPELDDDEFQSMLFEPRADRTVVFRTSRVMRRLTWALIAVGNVPAAAIVLAMVGQFPATALMIPGLIGVTFILIAFSRSHLTIDTTGVRYLGGVMVTRREIAWTAVTDIAVRDKEIQITTKDDLDWPPAFLRHYPTTIVLRSGKIETRLRAPDQLGKTFPQFMAAVTRAWWRDALQQQSQEA